MSLTSTNFVPLGPIKSVDMKQFVDLFTGVMIDQPVTFKNALLVGGNQGSSTAPLKLYGVALQTGNLIELYPSNASASPTFGFGALGNFAWGPGSPTANDTFLSRIAQQNGHVVDTAGILITPYLEVAGNVSATTYAFSNSATITGPSANPFRLVVNQDLVVSGTLTVPNGTITNAMLGADVARDNLLTNGGFDIWQRGNGPFTGPSLIGPDRWYVAPTGTDTLSVSRDTTNVDVALGSRTAAACTFVLGSGGGNSVVYQPLKSLEYEMAGRPFSASLRVRVGTANAVRLGLYNGSATSFSSFHTGDGTWQTLTVTATPVYGTVMFQILFAASCTAYLDNAMLVVGSQAANYVPMHPADDLARCMRYYEVGALKPINVYGSAGAQMGMPIWYRAWKAVSPTLTKVSAWSVTNGSAPNLNYAHQDGCDAMWTCGVLGATTIGPSAAIDWTAEANP